MDQRQRVVMQRALAQEALGKLRAAAELFAAEDGAVAGDDKHTADFEAWQATVSAFERWLWDDSPIA